MKAVLPGFKRCRRCKRSLPKSSFSVAYKKTGALKTWCRECVNSYSKDRRITHPMEHKKHVKTYRAKYPCRVWAATSYFNHFKKYAIEFSAKWLESFALASPTCAYCGITLNYAPPHNSDYDHRATLDRINNESILTKSNVRIVCYRCNTAKGNRTLAEYLIHCDTVLTHLSESIHF
jgi:5-methylcytosine-specific restriction endonuclease McrA